MSTLDLLLALVVVAAAAGFLLWQLGLRQRPPACHPGGGAAKRHGRARASDGPNVILDDKLARALAKAKAKRRSL